jgi:drug/metabolite transporter (DMT)-like permease
MNNKKAIIYAIISALLWSTVATAFKFALMHFNVISMLLLSTLTSFLFLLIYGIITNKIRSTFNISMKYHLKSILLGIINPIAYYLVLFKAYELLPAQEAQTLNYSWSITVVIFSSIFLGQKIRTLNFIALFISFIGVIIIAKETPIGSSKFRLRISPFKAIIITPIKLINNALKFKVLIFCSRNIEEKITIVIDHE